MTLEAVRLADRAWDDAVGLFRATGDATLVCHVAPDGDALGSMLALARGLRLLGIRVTCTWGDERWSVPSSYSWLPDVDTAVDPSCVDQCPSLLVVLDTGSVDRLGVLGHLAKAASNVIVIDHHAHSSGLAGVQLVVVAAAATAAVVEELLCRLDVKLDAEMATLHYVGLATDTGSFQHPVTTAGVHALAGRLLEAGATPDDVARRLWGSQPYGLVQVMGAALSRSRLEPDALGGRGLVWTWTTREDLTAAGLGIDEIEPIIDVVRTAREADVAAVLKQDVDGSFRVSTR
jgi:phosphoesterase RecJ-like protein